MKNIVLSCSQQSGNKCLLCASEELHTFEIAKRVAELLKQYDANVCLIPKELAGTENNVLAQVVKMSNDFIMANGGKGRHLDFHTDGGYDATGSSGFYISENGRVFITAIHKEVSALTPFPDGRVSKRDNLFVLNATVAVSGVIEICFHDKINEATWLHDNLNNIALGIVRGFVLDCGLVKKVPDINVAKVEDKEEIKKQILELVNKL